MDVPKLLAESIIHSDRIKSLSQNEVDDLLRFSRKRFKHLFQTEEPTVEEALSTIAVSAFKAGQMYEYSKHEQ